MKKGCGFTRVSARWSTSGVGAGGGGGEGCECPCNVWRGLGSGAWSERRINTARPLPRHAARTISAGLTSFDAIACFFIAPINHALR